MSGAGWYLDDERIFVQEFEINGKSIIAKLNPLSGGSIYHYWGYENEDIKLKFYVVGDEQRGYIAEMERDGNTHVLMGSGLQHDQWNFSIDVYIVDASYKAVPIVCQTLRPDLDPKSQVWIVDANLYWDHD